jgi:ATP-binding cassette, subfamily B, bacterial PglK
VKIKSRLVKSAVYQSFELLPVADRVKLCFLAAAQFFLGFLDLIGIGLIGILSSVAVRGVQSQAAGSRVTSILKFMNLESSPLQSQVAVLGIIAVSIMLSRTYLSVMLTRRNLEFLGSRGAILSAELFKKTLNLPIVVLQSKNSQDRLFALTNSVTTIMTGILAPAANLLSDFSVLVFLLIGLFVFDPVTAILSIFIFGSVALLMYFLLHKKARRLGKAEAELNIRTNESVLDAINLFREIYIRDKKDDYANQFQDARAKQANISAQLSFLPSISKYISESVLLIATLSVAAVQFIFNDAAHATAAFGIFLAAGSRMAPAIMRLQSSSLLIKGNLGNSQIGFDFISELKNYSVPARTISSKPSDKLFSGSIEINEVTFRYPGAEEPALSRVSLQIAKGSRVALVGPSGAGKSTLADLILGVLTPDSGTIKVSGVTPVEAIRNWPDKISYAPQNTFILNGSILENLTLASENDEDSRISAWKALEVAQLADYVSELPEMLDSQVGENGNRLSGGQRQRLGIARTLFSNPKVIVLDESTSALDVQTEALFMDAFMNLGDEVTTITVAHRLSTIRNSDQIVYIDHGKILATGSFDYVRKTIPDFDDQALASGL